MGCQPEKDKDRNSGLVREEGSKVLCPQLSRSTLFLVTASIEEAETRDS